MNSLKLVCIGILLASANVSACTLKDTRVCDIDNVLKQANNNHVVQYKEGDDSGVAAEYEMVAGAADIIHLGDTRDYSYNELFYLVSHEYGHSVKKHTRKLLEAVASKEDVALSDAALIVKYKDKIDSVPASFNYQQEFEADEFAVKMMATSGKDALSAMKSVLKSGGNSQWHPSRNARLSKAKEIILALAK